MTSFVKLNHDKHHLSYESSFVWTEYNNSWCVFLPAQGYWGPRALIAAQTPLPDTMEDFWSMVYQKKASTVVMLSDCDEDKVAEESNM